MDTQASPNDSVAIATFEKNKKEEVRVSVETFHGRKIINIRVFFKDDDGVPHRINNQAGRVGGPHARQAIVNEATQLAEVPRESGSRGRHGAHWSLSSLSTRCEASFSSPRSVSCSMRRSAAPS